MAEVVGNPDTDFVEGFQGDVGVEEYLVVVVSTLQHRERLVDANFQVGKEDSIGAEPGCDQHLVEVILLAPTQRERRVPRDEFIIQLFYPGQK